MCGKEKRIIYIDILRIVACLMVIFNHTNERGFLLFLNDGQGIPSFVWHLLCATICKNGVPIFFMISGSLLLNKDESLRDTYKRLPRIIIDVLLFSLLYFWIGAKSAGRCLWLKVHCKQCW